MNATTHHDIIIEDGHASAPGGTYCFFVDLPEIGYRDVNVEVQWTMAGDRVSIEGVEVSDVFEGPQMLDPNHGTSLEKAMYVRLAAEALARRDDILEAYREGL